MGVFSKTVFDLSPSPSALCRELVYSHRFSASFCGNGFQDCQLQLWSEGSPGPQVLHFLLLWPICTWMLSTAWNSLQSTSQSFHPLSYMFPERRKQSTSPGLPRREEDFGPPVLKLPLLARAMAPHQVSFSSLMAHFFFFFADFCFSLPRLLSRSKFLAGFPPAFSVGDLRPILLTEIWSLLPISLLHCSFLASLCGLLAAHLFSAWTLTWVKFFQSHPHAWVFISVVHIVKHMFNFHNL